MAQTVTSISPSLNSDDVSVDQNITINFSEGMDNTTINSSTVIISGSQRGVYSGSFSYGTNSATFDPSESFFAGEIITVIVTDGVENASNTPITSPYRTMFTAAASGNGEFSTSDVYTADGSNFTDRTITADINEDGYVDIITLVPTLDKMSVFTNDGDGSFSGPTNYTTANSFQVEATDVNNDGAIDLVTSNNNAYMMSVFMNNGGGLGTFASKVDYANGSSWNGKGLATGDIDNDGDEDVLIDVIIGGTVDSVQVFTNDGDGTFTLGGGISTSDQFEQIKLWDIDGDEDLDFVGLSPGLGQLVTYDNDGSGSFSLNTTHTATSSSYQFTLGNFVSSSATIEAITADQTNDQIRYFGDGTIHAFGATPVTTLVGDTPVAIASGDINGDGHIDVVVSNYTDQNLSILTNDGNASFTESNYSTTGTYANYISLSDVDNDGDLDIVMGNQDGTLAVADNFEGTQVTSITPANGSTKIATTANITVKFNDAMKESTLNSTNVTVVGNAAGTISATYTYNSGDSTLTIDPSSDFVLGDDITVTVTTNVTNEGDQPIASSASSTFTIDGVNVQSITPTPNTAGVTASSNIDITFNDTMDGTSLTSSNILVFGSLSGNVAGSITTGSNSATFDPTADFLAGEEVSVIVTTGVENSSNVAMSEPNVFQFTVDGSAEYIAQGDSLESVGQDPNDVVILDADVDGDLDLIVTNGTDNTVTIMLNDGTGAFTSSSTLATGSTPLSISTGDFDNANGMDFVVTNYAENDIRVYSNNGSGSFTTADYATGSGPIDVAVGDMNGDGYTDIIVHNRNGATEQIFTNDGDGTFTSAGTVTTTTNMDRVFVADLDNDDDLDIASGGAGVGLYIALNNGDATFATATATSITSKGADFIDLNGDDYLDLVVSDDNSNEVSVHLNNGDGSFGSATDYTVSDASDLSVFDHGNDGDMDIAVVNFNGSEVQVLENGGSGMFTSGQTFNVGTWPEILSIADLDEDGQLDFVTVNRGSDNVSINYGAEFVEVTSTSPANNALAVSATSNITATFNYDMNSSTLNSSTVLVNGSNSGLLSGVITFDSPSKTMTFNPDNSFKAGEVITVTITTGAQNTTGSALTYTETFSFTAEAGSAGYFTTATESSVFPNYVSDLFGVDLDNDGDQDMVGVYNNYFSVRFNDGSGTYGYGTATDYNLNSVTSILPADLDNDGDVDILAMRGNDKILVAMENNGSGVFTQKSTLSTNQVISGGRWDVGDFNNDGIIDVAMTGDDGSGNAIYIYNNDGAMNFTLYHESGTIAGTNDIFVTDLNNDGHLDFITSGYYESYGVLLNNGDGTLGAETTFSAPSESSTRGIAADVDGDGYNDLIISNYYAAGGSNFTVRLNNGDGTFGSGTDYGLSFDGFWVYTGDMDGDNDLDLVFGRSSASAIAFNDGSGGFDEIVNYSTSGTNPGAAVYDYDGDTDLDVVLPYYSNVTYLTNTAPPTPSSAVTNLSFSNIVAEQVTASWTNGDGTGRLVVAKQGSAVDATPTDDTFYTAGDFGTGSEIGTGNYVVYTGTENTADIAGLTPDSTYHFAVYEYNKGGSQIKYLTTTPATGSTTTKLYPTTASTVSIDDDQGTLLDLSWSGGDGAKQLVVIREGSAITWEPSDSTTYSANSSFTSAADLGDGTKVISNDNTGSVTVTDLSLSTTYYVEVFDYNGSAGFETYLRSSTGIASTTTQSFEGTAFDSTAGYAYKFDGGNSFERYGELYTNGDVIIDDHFTTELWIKPDSLGIQQYFLSWYEEQLVLGINSSNQLFGFHTQQGTGGSKVTVTGTTTLTKGEWYHVALTGETGGNLTLYVNGVEEASSAITDVSGDGNYDDYWYLGTEYAENNYFYGSVDELRIWSSVRTESEIRSFMHRPYIGLTNDLGAYWQFNEGTGDGTDALNSYAVGFYDENGWVQSSAPLGGRSMYNEIGVQSGTLSLGNVTVDVTESFDTAVDVYAFEIGSSGSTFPDEAFYPAGYSSLFGDSHFIIKVFGDPGTFSADLTLDFGSGNIPSGYDATPDSLTLYSRSTNSEGSWNEIGGASSVSSAAGTATWSGLTSFSQFAAVDTGNIAAPSVTFTKANYADVSLEANQDRIAYDVWITRGDDRGLYNAYSETSFNSSTSPEGTVWAYGTTADVESLTFENWRSAVSSDPPSSVGKSMVMYLWEHDVYVDIVFDSWNNGEDSPGGGFSYTRSEVNIPAPAPITFDSTAGFALDFDGTDDRIYESNYVSVIDDYRASPDPATYEMWVNPDTVGGQKMIMASSYGSDYEIGIDSTGNFYAQFRESGFPGAYRRATGVTTANKNQWYHVAASVQSSGFVKLYINGVIEDSVGIGTISTSNDAYYYGGSRYLKDGSDYHFYDGQMDELRIWQVARSDSAIRAGMYSSNLNADKTEILSYWQMNEGSGTSVSDLANGRDLDLSQDAQPAWITSGVPIGNGTSTITENFTDGSVTVGKASLDMADGFDNPVDVQVTEVDGDPNQFPSGFTAGVGGKYFVINLFGDPGVFSASLTLDYGAGVITEAQEATPSLVKLYKRSSTSTDEWTEVGGATTAVAATGLVTWTGITSFSQFIAVADEPVFGISIADGSDVVSYTDSTFEFTSDFFGLGSFADTELTINAKSTLSGNLFLDQNDNGVYDDGTDNLLTAGSEFSYTPSGSVKLRYASSTASFDTTTIKLQTSTEADSVQLDFYTLEAAPELAGNTGEGGWYLLANPSDSTVGMLLKNVWTQGAVNSDAPTGDATIYTFSQDSSVYVPITTDLDTTRLSAGEGLLVYIFEDDDILDGQDDIDGGWPKTLSNYGNPFGTDVSIPVKNVNHDGVTGTTGSEGFVLMGNPYGWPLSADSVIATMKREDPLANSYVYRWKPVEKVYELASTGSIDPYESFFVRVVTSGSNGTLSFDYEDAAISAPAKQADQDPFEITLSHSESKLESNSFIRLGEEGDANIDPFDGYYLGTYASSFANLYTLIGDQPLTINNLPMAWEGDLEYPIYLHATEKGDFSIEWDNEALPEGITATLEHVESGDKISLTDQDSYTFKVGEIFQNVVGNEKLGSYQRLGKERVKQKVKPVFVLTISSSLGTSNENELGIPEEVELYQNYPNPFNPTSVIRYGVPEASKVRLEVFDILGRKVMTLVNNENKNPGRYNVEFNARSLASGLYIYRLVVGDKVMTKKMTLIK